MLRPSNARLLLLMIGAAAAISSAGCGAGVSGTPEPAGQERTATGTGAEADIDREQEEGVGTALDALLINPSAFPVRYEAIVLPPQAIAQATPDLTGIPAGAEVSPAGCKPKDVQPGDAALIVGTDNADRATISIELTSVEEPLSVRETQLEECAEVRATKAGVTSNIRSTITPAPPIDADDTLAVRQTVSSGSGTDSVTQSMLTLMAQVGDVRIAATYMSFDSAPPDAAALDQLFKAAVQKVRAG